MIKIIPSVDITSFLKKDSYCKNECETVVKAFRETGCLIVKDPRVNQSHNNEVIEMLEKFFLSRSQSFYKNKTSADIFPENNYQIGATPELKELPKNHCTLIKQMAGNNKPMSECPPPLDPKWRYLWKIGDRPPETDKDVDPPVNIPEGFPDWKNVMNRWGNFMHESCLTVARMLAIGLKLDENTFVDKMYQASHLLAPTGSDLSKYKTGTVFASFHCDFNFLTIHGKSKFPGLYVWLKDGTRVQVVVPDGCLILQAGKQLEYLTGGFIEAGYHEVVFDNTTQAVLDKYDKTTNSPWRVSSTFFSHINKNVILEPLEHFSTTESRQEYPPLLTKKQILEELKAIKLAD